MIKDMNIVRMLRELEPHAANFSIQSGTNTFTIIQQPATPILNCKFTRNAPTARSMRSHHSNYLLCLNLLLRGASIYI